MRTLNELIDDILNQSERDNYLKLSATENMVAVNEDTDPIQESSFDHPSYYTLQCLPQTQGPNGNGEYKSEVGLIDPFGEY